MKKPNNYEEIFNLVNQNKIPFRDRYYINRNQIELAKELNVPYQNVNNCFCIFKRKGYVLREGMNYYLSQKGRKAADFSKEYHADFAEFLEYMCSLMQAATPEDTVKTSISAAKENCQISDEDISIFNSILRREGFAKIDGDIVEFTPIGIERFQFYKVNYYI